LIEALTKDGVLKSTDKVSIEVNNVKIIINGQALTDEQNAKYSGLIQKK
jgi:predicted DNA-binding antitoxin AbrB/MazE fold protein